MTDFFYVLLVKKGDPEKKKTVPQRGEKAEK